MRTRGLISLVPTLLLCLPSLGGAVVLAGNAILQRHMQGWGIFSSLTLAAAVFLGGPLVGLAVVVATLFGLSRRIAPPVMYCHYLIVIIAACATVSLTMRFGM